MAKRKERENKPWLAKAAARRSYEKHREKRRVERRNYYTQNREALCRYQAEKRKNNPEKAKVKDKKKYERLKADPERRQKHLETRRAYISRRLNEDPEFAILKKVRGRILSALARENTGKKNKTLHLIGCTKEHLRMHLEKQFKKGMAWSNHGSLWHIDHIVPCSAFDLTTEEGQKRCFHYSNLRPLRKMENLEKNDKIITCQPELTLSLV